MSAPVNTAHAADITIVIGSSGAGKSSWIKQAIKQRRKALIFDIEGEYAAPVRATNIPDLADAIIASADGGPGVIAYTGEAEDFPAFCDAALYAKGFCIVVEELAELVPPGKAPKSWGRLTRTMRKRGASIIAATIHPAETDKTVLRNATKKIILWMNTQADRDYVCKVCGVEAQQIDRIQPPEPQKQCHFLVCDQGKPPRLGKLVFNRS